MILNPLLHNHPRPINKTINCPDITQEGIKTVIISRTVTKTVLQDIKSTVSSIEEEVKLLRTVLYKNHNRFRNDKGYKTLRMLEKNTLKFLNQNFSSVISDFLELVPASPSTQSVSLPTLAMCQYCMLLVYQAAAVVSKAEAISRLTGLLNVQRLNLGHFWGVAAVNLGMVARLWTLLKCVLVKLHTLYKHLGLMSEQLPGQSDQFQLPGDLSEFSDNQMVPPEKDKEVTLQPISETSNITTVEDFLDLDLGEPVKRKVDKDENKEETKSIKKRKIEAEIKSNKSDGKDFLSEIHSLDELKAFLANETSSRKTSKKTSLTKKLSQDQWRTLRKEVLDNIIPSKPNRSIKLCRKIIRNALGLP